MKAASRPTNLSVVGKYKEECWMMLTNRLLMDHVERFSPIRKDLRGLQAVSDGTIAKFSIKDHQIRAKQRAATKATTRTRGQESGRDDGHQIRKARRNRPKVITHEDRLREQAYRALGLLPDPEVPIVSPTSMHQQNCRRSVLTQRSTRTPPIKNHAEISLRLATFMT